MITSEDILTDAQAAKLARVSLDAFQRRLRNGIPVGELDWNAASPFIVAGRRRWFRCDIERIIRDRIIVKA